MTAWGRPDQRTGRLVELYKRYGTLLRYALVGASGYLIYLGLIAVLYDLELLPLAGKEESVNLGLFTHSDELFLVTTLIGTQASIMVVFAGHTLWTFAGTEIAQKPLWLRFVQFEGRALISTLGVLTVAVNGALLAGASHFVALPFGLVVGFAWNWLWDSHVIWSKARQRQ